VKGLGVCRGSVRVFFFHRATLQARRFAFKTVSVRGITSHNQQRFANEYGGDSASRCQPHSNRIAIVPEGR